MRSHVLLTVALLAASCGGSSTGTSQSSTGPLITISGLAFRPLKLQVRPGDTVTVENQDPMQHSVTSEAAPGAYQPGAVNGVSFDTGLFTGTAHFTIPASAPVGTVVPYYCRNHRSSMATPNGEIDVVASASPADGGAPSPPPTGTGY